MNLSMITTTTNIFIADNPVLTSVNLSNLKTVVGHLYFHNCPLLNSLNLSSLESVFMNSGSSDYAIAIDKINVVNLAFPALKKIVGAMSMSFNISLNTVSFPLLKEATSLGMTWNSHLTSLLAPELTKADFIYLEGNLATGFSTLSLPSLSSIGQIYINRSYLTSISFPALTRITAVAPLPTQDIGSYITNCTLLTNIEFGNLVQFSNDYFNINAKLPSSGVNYLLNKFVSMSPSITGKHFDFRMTPLAPPTGQGIIDKATLTTNGNTVTTN
ncbi:MAG: hypothetical protein QM737_14475 [Ferruginibacter sp.]